MPFGGDTRELVRQAKRQIRLRMRALRGAVPSAACGERSTKIAEKLRHLPELAEAGRVALFWPMHDEHEVDLRALDAELRARGVVLYYPFMDPTSDGYRTGFRRLDDPASLVDRGRGFAEPPTGGAEARAGDLDVVVVPALAVSSDGHRVGYGIGFYDATLPDVCPPARAVIVAFGFQLMAEVPSVSSDFAGDVVVTDETIIVPGASSG